MSRQRGFTLIELLVAITIIAIIGAVSIPNYRSFARKQNVKNAAKGLADTLKVAQTNARTQTKCPDPSGINTASRDWDVVYGLTSYYLRVGCYNPSGVYNLTLYPGTGPGTGNWIQINVPNTTVQFPSGVTVSFSSNNQWNTNALDFLPGGQTNNDDGFPWPITITFSDGSTTSNVQVDNAGNITTN